MKWTNISFLEILSICMTMAAGQSREGAPPPPSLDPIVLPSTDDHKIAFGDRIPITSSTGQLTTTPQKRPSYSPPAPQERISTTYDDDEEPSRSSSSNSRSSNSYKEPSSSRRQSSYKQRQSNYGQNSYRRQSIYQQSSYRRRTSYQQSTWFNCQRTRYTDRYGRYRQYCCRWITDRYGRYRKYCAYSAY